LLASEILEHRYQVEEFVVVCVREPAADGDGVLRMKNVGGGRVVDNDGILEVTANLGEILYVIALVVVAAFTEETVVDDAVDVELVEERVTILGYRCGENDNLVQFAHSLHELVHARPLDNIDVMVLTFNFNGNREIGLVKNLEQISKQTANTTVMLTYLEAAVDQSLVKVENQALFALEPGSNGSQKVFLLLRGFTRVCSLLLHSHLSLGQRWWRRQVDLWMLWFSFGVSRVSLMRNLFGRKRHISHLNVAVNLLLLLGLILYYTLLLCRWTGQDWSNGRCRVGDAYLRMTSL
jgi:hypothetical protein